MSNIGEVVNGYCGGYFGKFDWSTKEIIAEGKKWILCRYTDGENEYGEEVILANFDSEEEKDRLIEEWCSSDV